MEARMAKSKQVKREMIRRQFDGIDENSIFIRQINKIVKNIPTWRGIPNYSSTPYEFFADYLRDYYEVTLNQCDEICKMLKEYYKISKFYH